MLRRVLRKSLILEPRSGLEPETSSLPWMRSTNWAIAAYYHYRACALRIFAFHAGAIAALVRAGAACLCLGKNLCQSLLILTYLPRSRQATSGGGFSCWLSIRVLAGSALRTLPIVPRRYRLPSKLLRIRQQSSRPSGFAVHLGASATRLEPAQWKLLLDKLAVICGADLFGGSSCSATA